MENNTSKNNIRYNEVINKIQHYMINAKLITNSCKHNDTGFSDTVLQLKDNTNIMLDNLNKSIKKDQESQKKDNTLFFPKEKDQLFWCYYILANGHIKYETLDTLKFITEKNEKLKCIETLRFHKKILSANKIRGLDSIESNLVNDKAIDTKTFMALCAVSNINIMFVHRRKVFEFIPDVDNESNINIIHQYDEPSVRYAYETDVNNERIAIYKNSQDIPESSTVYFKSNSISNPLKAISSYKVAELKDLCVKLKLIDSKEIVKKTKPQLYEIIIKNL